MYNYIDDKFLNSNIGSAFSISSKNVNSFIRGRFNIKNFSQLPSIKEEEGISSEDEIEVNCRAISSKKPSTKLPPLNINCLMNIDIKQSHSIWNTNFGKRLINKNSVCEAFSEPDFKESQFLNETNKKFHPSKSFTRTKNYGKNSKGEKKEYSQTGNSKKKSKKFSKENQSLLKKKINNERKSSSSTLKTKSSDEFSGSTKTLIDEETSTASLETKPQQFLSEYVKTILEDPSDEFKCEHCNKSFPLIEELCNHEKEHELEKETCLLCDKVFYNSSKFVEHLLSHEGVDRFSCKKCKKYFPNLKKYTQHNQEFHCKRSPSVNFISPPKQEFVEKWLPKFECKRCKLELDNEKSYETHKRAHLRKDLARAYLQSAKYI